MSGDYSIGGHFDMPNARRPATVAEIYRDWKVMAVPDFYDEGAVGFQWEHGDAETIEGARADIDKWIEDEPDRINHERSLPEW